MMPCLVDLEQMCVYLCSFFLLCISWFCIQHVELGLSTLCELVLKRPAAKNAFLLTLLDLTSHTREMVSVTCSLFFFLGGPDGLCFDKLRLPVLVEICTLAHWELQVCASHQVLEDNFLLTGHILAKQQGLDFGTRSKLYWHRLKSKF